jgi:NAD(P)-dependent dehydrogenase (short-subunit alcohol dehydrogenase family)
VSAAGSLTGRCAWVTGAGTGIGAASALALAASGAHVVLTGRRADRLETVAAQIRQAGGSAQVAAGDVTDPVQIDAILAELRSSRPGLDILVNNAGTNIPNRSWSELTAAAIDHLVDANLRAALHVSRAALPWMRETGGGLLVHIASWAAYAISEGPGPAYTAAKSGLVAMSRTINLEHNRHGIRSCALSPGDVHTPLMDQRPVIMSEEARRRMLQPEDVADLVLHLAALQPRVCVNEIVVGPTFS